MKKIFVAFILALVMLFAAGCSAVQEDAVGIRGEVTSITTGKGYIVLLVEGEVHDDTMYGKASVTMNADTKVVRIKDGEETPADMLDIMLFDTVEVVFEGPVAESYPVQGTAKIVRILS